MGVILALFFPLPKLPGINLAPHNFVFLVAVLVCGARLTRLAFGGGPVGVVALLVSVFALLDWTHDLVLREPIVNPAGQLRGVIYLLLLVEVCSYTTSRLQIMKFLVVVGVIQVIFGSLVYFVGEPFVAIRTWMLQSSSSEEDLIAVGSQLSSLYGAAFTFGYLLASFPFLAISLYLRERKLVWLLASVVLLLGLLLNAERAAGAAVFFGLLYLVWKSKNRAGNLVVIAIVATAFIGVQSFVASRMEAAVAAGAGMVSYQHGTLAERFGKSSLDELTERVMYQVHGITSVFKHPVLGPTQIEYAREVLGGSTILSGAMATDVMAPHNHYINAGVQGGVLGWVILAGCLWALWKAHSTVRVAIRRTSRPGLRMEFLCVLVGLAAVLGNAVFHNAGIFSAELATISLIGLLLAQYQQMKRETAVCWTVPSPAGKGEPTDVLGRVTPRA